MNNQSNGQPEVIARELLDILHAAKQAAVVAESEFNTISRYVIAHYNMQGMDTLELTTGVITRSAQAPQSPAAEPAPQETT